MRKILGFLFALACSIATAQTFTVNNLVVNGVISGNGAPIQRVTNLAALRLIPCISGQLYATDAYSAIGDHGEGIYVCNGLDTTSTDNGGTIIATANTNRAYLLYATSTRLEQWGGDDTGISDASTPFQKALSSGIPLDLGPASNTWKINTGATTSGKITLFGRGATISSNVTFLTATDCNYCNIYGFNVLPQSVPFTIHRNTTSWAAPTPTQTYQGYMPGAQDNDVWPTFNGTAGQILNATLKPMLLFTVSSSAGASYLSVHDITGYALAIVIQGYTNIQVHDNNFGGSGTTYGSVVVLNGVPVGYNSAPFGFTPPRGVNNQIYNNTLQYSTLCAIVLFGNDDYGIVNNTASFNGESGIKTYQYDGVAGPSATSAVISTTGRIVGNKSSDNYYDGIDAAIYNGVAQTYAYIGTVIANNIGERNHQTGSITNGYDMIYTGNHFNSNGTHGLAVTGGINTVIGNYARDNMTTGTTQVAQPFDIVVEGDDMTVSGNSVFNTTAFPTFNFFHTGLLGAAPTSGHEGIDSGNYSSRGMASINVSSTIPANKSQFLSQGPLVTSAYVQSSAVTSVTGTTYTVSATDTALSVFPSAAFTMTMPAAASFCGREISMRNTAAFTISSSASNIGPLAGGAPSTALLTATAGKWLVVKSDCSNWIIMSAN